MTPPKNFLSPAQDKGIATFDAVMFTYRYRGKFSRKILISQLRQLYCICPENTYHFKGKHYRSSHVLIYLMNVSELYTATIFSKEKKDNNSVSCALKF